MGGWSDLSSFGLDVALAFVEEEKRRRRRRVSREGDQGVFD